MSRIIIAILGTALLLAGCANKPSRYDWGGYDSSLYGYYKNPNSAEGFRVSMETQFKQLESRNQKPAPGLYAELGTLYLESGDRTTAATYYRKEHDAWPESRYLMDVMIKNLEKMTPGKKPQ
jgi:hypothetical protein